MRTPQGGRGDPMCPFLILKKPVGPEETPIGEKKYKGFSFYHPQSPAGNPRKPLETLGNPLDFAPETLLYNINYVPQKIRYREIRGHIMLT